jgi:hypothetical protein
MPGKLKGVFERQRASTNYFRYSKRNKIEKKEEETTIFLHFVPMMQQPGWTERRQKNQDAT